MNISISITDVITWLIVGALAGSMAGMLVKVKKKGFGHIMNMGVGLVGALIGGMVFKVIPIARPLAAISISLEDIVAGLVGSLLFLLAIRVMRKRAAKAALPVAPTST